jgi:hypothetical protein
MSRPLLHLETALFIEGGAPADPAFMASLRVLEEYHAPKRSPDARYFNTDVLIKIRAWIGGEKRNGKCVPVRPNTMGAEYFVMLDPTATPISLHLLNGESIPISSFREEIDRITSVVDQLDGLPRPVSINHVPYLRVVRLSTSIAFVVATCTDIVALLQASAQPLDAGRHLCALHQYCGEFLIDGVILDEESP